MHSAERVLLPLLKIIGGKSGCNNIYSLIQNIFKFGYYCKKYWSIIFATLAILFSPRECDEIRNTLFDSDGNINYDDMAENYLVSEKKGDFVDNKVPFISAANIPKGIGDIFGNICCSRWMSFVRQAEKLIQFLNIPAPEKMIELVKEGVEQSDKELEKLLGVATCFGDKSKVSLWCLIFYYIAHHSAGGKYGDLRKNGFEVCSFLCSPSFRVGLSICSTIYPVEIEWAEFFNSKTKINKNTACISTRVK